MHADYLRHYDREENPNGRYFLFNDLDLKDEDDDSDDENIVDALKQWIWVHTLGWMSTGFPYRLQYEEDHWFMAQTTPMWELEYNDTLPLGTHEWFTECIIEGKLQKCGTNVTIKCIETDKTKKKVKFHDLEVEDMFQYV